MINTKRENKEGYNAITIGDYKLYAVNGNTDQFHIKKPYAKVMKYVEMLLQMELDRFKVYPKDPEVPFKFSNTIEMIAYDIKDFEGFNIYSLLDTKLVIEEIHSHVKFCVQVIDTLELIPSEGSVPHMTFYVNEWLFNFCLLYNDTRIVSKLMSALLLTSAEKNLFKLALENDNVYMSLEDIAYALALSKSFTTNPRMVTKYVVKTIEGINSKINCNLCYSKGYDGRKVVSLKFNF